jgi:CubicO group peptidase (beta-lactamase class C family)
MKMSISTGHLSCMLIVCLCMSCEDFDPDTMEVHSGGLLLTKEQTLEIDDAVRPYASHYQYISLGIVMEGEKVLVRTYREDRIGKTDEYASVSKTVTSMITFRLLEEGRIASLDDPIGDYCEKYANVLPDKYPDVKITFAHLLSHRSGIPHQDNIWKDGKLDLAFEPGSSIMYSTRGYGVLGEVLSEITGKSFSKLVREYIAEPAGAGSLSCPSPFFEAPAGSVKSDISDFACFARAVMNGTYVEDSLLYGLAWKPIAIDPVGMMAMGWYIEIMEYRGPWVYHAGSNGKPRAFMILEPQQQNGIVLLAKNENSDGKQELPALGRELLEVVGYFTSE